MNCEEALVLVHALADGELDAGNAREVEAHVARCTRCAAGLVSTQEMKRTLQAHDLRFMAPASLRSRIEKVVPISRPATDRRTILKGFALGSVMSAIAASGIGFVLVREATETRVIGEALSAHLRSLQGDHLTDVLSSNQHTVKPWFNGRLDLAPPVVDLTGEGFTLIGGRLDYIDAKPVAALVYRRRKHIINLFVGEGLGYASVLPTWQVVQGYNVLRWSDGGLVLLAVSDLNQEELQEFSHKFIATTKAANTRP
jgi:anti-sigma factor RsiW